MSEKAADKKWYSAEDVEVAKMALSDLPDLTPSRLTKNDVLEQIKDQIIELSTKKGYSLDDIHSALESVGIKTSVKSIRDILNASKKKNTPRNRPPRSNAVTNAANQESKNSETA